MIEFEAEMSTRIENYLEAVEHLPDDAALILQGVTWNEYEQLLEDMNNWPGMRVTYYKGRLEIVSPSLKHEKIKIFLHDLVTAFCDYKKIAMENAGSTTFKRERDEEGAEPDVCFYVTNIEGIIGKDDVDPDSDPLPDIAIEVDITNTSTTKFQIYRNFRIPEIWRHDGKCMRFYRLTEDEYVEIPDSAVLPGLTSQLVTDFVEQSRIQGRTRALAAFGLRLDNSTQGTD
jgi:Uma2 family endonuclease